MSNKRIGNLSLDGKLWTMKHISIFRNDVCIENRDKGLL